MGMECARRLGCLLFLLASSPGLLHGASAGETDPKAALVELLRGDEAVARTTLSVQLTARSQELANRPATKAATVDEALAAMDSLVKVCDLGRGWIQVEATKWAATGKAPPKATLDTMMAAAVRLRTPLDQAAEAGRQVVGDPKVDSQKREIFTQKERFCAEFFTMTAALLRGSGADKVRGELLDTAKAHGDSQFTLQVIDEMPEARFWSVLRAVRPRVPGATTLGTNASQPATRRLRGEYLWILAAARHVLEATAQGDVDAVAQATSAPLANEDRAKILANKGGSLLDLGTVRFSPIERGRTVIALENMRLRRADQTETTGRTVLAVRVEGERLLFDRVVDAVAFGPETYSQDDLVTAAFVEAIAKGMANGRVDALKASFKPGHWPVGDLQEGSRLLTKFEPKVSELLLVDLGGSQMQIRASLAGASGQRHAEMRLIAERGQDKKWSGIAVQVHILSEQGK